MILKRMIPEGEPPTNEELRLDVLTRKLPRNEEATIEVKGCPCADCVAGVPPRASHLKDPSDQ